MENLVAAQNLYLVNNPHVYGMSVAWAIQDVLGWKHDTIKAALMKAHTEGFCSLGSFLNAPELQKKMETLLSEEGYLQKVFCLSHELPSHKEIQDKTDVVQRLAVIPELVEVGGHLKKMIR